MLHLKDGMHGEECYEEEQEAAHEKQEPAQRPGIIDAADTLPGTPLSLLTSRHGLKRLCHIIHLQRPRVFEAA